MRRFFALAFMHGAVGEYKSVIEKPDKRFGQ